jgi:ribosomal protein S18 acetylase RimI-like enzyme
MPIGLATSADVPALVRVINRAYLVEAHIFHGSRTDEAEVAARLAKPDACFLVLEGDNISEPTMLGAVYVEACGERAYFGMLSVDPDAQGRRLGRTLIEAAEARGAASGCTVMDIDVVDQRGELLGYYARFGYAVNGDARPYANEAATKMPVALIRMSKRLDGSASTPTRGVTGS